jgi:hypothetical protein
MFDTFVAPGLVRDPWMVVGKRTVAEAVSVDEWIRQMTAIKAITYPDRQCAAVEDEQTSELGGEEARLLAFHCPVDGPDAVAAQILAKHGRAGWLVMCYSEEKLGSLEALEQHCAEWLRGFAFLD